MLSCDTLSRGVDVQQIAAVVNYDLPNRREQYIHQIGRAGRFGRRAIAFTFVKKNETEKMEELETYYSANIQQVTIGELRNYLLNF